MIKTEFSEAALLGCENILLDCRILSLLYNYFYMNALEMDIHVNRTFIAS